MSFERLLELANSSGGILYLMALLLLVALAVIVERSLYLMRMQHHGESILSALADGKSLDTAASAVQQLVQAHPHLPHATLVQTALRERSAASRDEVAGHLEEAVMREVPSLDRALWLLDTVITLAPLLGLFGTIVGMFGTFSGFGQGQGDTERVTGGIAEALVATAFGLLIAMLGLSFFNWLNTRIRVIVHQLETLRQMLVNRHADRSTT